MEVEQAVRESRCQVAYREVKHKGVEFAGPYDDPEVEARIAGFQRELVLPDAEKAIRNVSLVYAVRHTDWQPCLPKTVIDKLGDLSETT